MHNVEGERKKKKKILLLASSTHPAIIDCTVPIIDVYFRGKK